MRKTSILLVLFSIFAASPAFARVDVSTDSAAQIEMNMRLEIPTNLSLRIGTKGSQVDTVRFNVTGLPEAQPRVEGDLHPTIEISSNLPTGCDLSADSTGGLKGAAAKIPFTAISFEGTGALSSIKGTFNATADQKLQRLAGKGKRQGAMRFVYNNTYKYPPGIYMGTVIFTLSTP
jgi:hypothetical protein